MESVAITGAMGTLGWKLLCHLASQGTFRRVFGLYHSEPDPRRIDTVRQLARSNTALDHPPDIDLRQCDLGDWADMRWREAIDQADAVVHLAWQNVWPDAPWPDAVASFDMTLHTVLAAVDSPRTRRFVFASSNHAVGGYKDPPLAEQIGPGGLHTDLDPAPGTIWNDGLKTIYSVKYGSAKVAGERLCRACALKAGGRKTFVCVRVGWCQHGENIPQNLAITWDQDRAKESPNPADWSSDLRWFKEMWLSDRDYTHLMERALLADGSGWPGGFLIVNGVSNNTGMRWSLEEARRWLGYEPKDDVYDAYRAQR
jgi:nucleoside-diphosphate-sugar epimerase